VRRTEKLFFGLDFTTKKYVRKRKKGEKRNGFSILESGDRRQTRTDAIFGFDLTAKQFTCKHENKL
jgi:hypothetical protein